MSPPAPYDPTSHLLLSPEQNSALTCPRAENSRHTRRRSARRRPRATPTSPSGWPHGGRRIPLTASSKRGKELRSSLCQSFRRLIELQRLQVDVSHLQISGFCRCSPRHGRPTVHDPPFCSAAGRAGVQHPRASGVNRSASIMPARRGRIEALPMSARALMLMACGTG